MTSITLKDAIGLIQGGRTEEGIYSLRQVASTGDPRALFVLGDLTWSGNMVEQDPHRGRVLFEYAAALGDSDANILATNLLASGIGGNRNWLSALRRLATECRENPARRACFNLIADMDLDDEGNPAQSFESIPVAKRPDAQLFSKLLTPTECAYLVTAAEGRFLPSSVYDSKGRLIRDTIRTSDGAAFHWLIEDPAVHALNRRIAAATSTTYEAGEPLQVLRYSAGQEYRPHFDFVSGAANQRLWTALVYLNADYGGGATRFVHTDVEVSGGIGDVLVFRNALPDGSLDPLSEHEGTRVTGGQKYLATRWIRERRWIP